MTAEEARAEGWREMAAASGFTDLIGAFWSRQDAHGWHYAALPDERHLNNRQIVHGGLLLGFADHALGLTLWEKAGRKSCVTAQLNMQFVDAAQPGELLEMDVEVVRMGRTLIVVRGTIRAGERAVAIADGIWKLVGPKRATNTSKTGTT